MACEADSNVSTSGTVGSVSIVNTVSVAWEHDLTYLQHSAAEIHRLCSFQMSSTVLNAKVVNLEATTCHHGDQDIINTRRYIRG